MRKQFSHNEILNYYVTLLNSMTEAHKRVEKLIAQVQPESLVEFETMHCIVTGKQIGRAHV